MSTSIALAQTERDIDRFRECYEAIKETMASVLVGQEQVVRLLSDLSGTASNLNGMEQRNVGDQIDVALPLPVPGFAIKAIEAIDIEAEAVTCGGWQSHRIEGASLANGKEMD